MHWLALIFRLGFGGMIWHVCVSWRRKCLWSSNWTPVAKVFHAIGKVLSHLHLLVATIAIQKGVTIREPQWANANGLSLAKLDLALGM